ncbi:MAG: DoxX family protein [Paracoccaceae bacterium]
MESDHAIDTKPHRFMRHTEFRSASHEATSDEPDHDIRRTSVCIPPLCKFDQNPWLAEVRFGGPTRKFQEYGLNRQIMGLVGIVKLFGAFAIWFQGSWIGTVGALALLGTSVGAIGCHLIWDTWKAGVPAMVTGSLSTFVAWSGKATPLGFLGLA